MRMWMLCVSNQVAELLVKVTGKEAELLEELDGDPCVATGLDELIGGGADFLCTSDGAVECDLGHSIIIIVVVLVSVDLGVTKHSSEPRICKAIFVIFYVPKIHVDNGGQFYYY